MRPLIVFVLSMFLFMGGYYWIGRDIKKFGMPETQWQMEKISAQPKFDIVLVGDSKVHNGLSPEHMKEMIGDKEILNFGFSGAGLTREYIRDAMKKFSPGFKERTLVLGVSPLTLTKNSLLGNDWRSWKEEQYRYNPWLAWIRHYLYFFRPISSHSLENLLRGRVHVGRTEIFHSGGWVEADCSPRDPKFFSDFYRRNFSLYKVEEVVTRELIEELEILSKSGVRLFGFRPPVSDVLYEIESKMSGFRENEFIKKFVDLGGFWIPIERNRYETYDGIHLEPKSAIRLSRLIGEEIKRVRPLSILKGV